MDFEPLSMNVFLPGWVCELVSDKDTHTVEHPGAFFEGGSTSMRWPCHMDFEPLSMNVLLPDWVCGLFSDKDAHIFVHPGVFSKAVQTR